jgi:hypothetical protein
MFVSDHQSGHNRRVRVACAALASIVASVVATSAARAHPVRDIDDLEPFDIKRDKINRGKGRMRMPPPQTPEQLCERNTSWPKLVKCLGKGGNTVKTLFDVGKGRVVSVTGNPSYGSASVYVYTQRNNRWERMNAYFASNPSTEILSFERLKHENGYRLEQGSIMKSSAFTGERFPGAEQTRVQVTLRRKTTAICLDNGYCQQLVTSCDALVDGKTRWSFRGTLRIDHGQVRMSGDRAYAGQVCAPAPSQISDLGDLLE